MSEEAVQTSNVQWRIDSWFPDLDKIALAKLKRYHDELIKFNRSVNLISVKTILQADAIHFADSILASRVIMKSDPAVDTIYDLGSGNGFPGLVFAILFPGVKVVLVDSDQRKTEFLKHCLMALELKNLSVQCLPYEALPPNSIKYCMARGLANISKAILTTRKIVATGGVFYHLKGENWSGEVGEIPTQLCSVWAPGLVGTYGLPVGDFKFAVIKTEKIG